MAEPITSVPAYSNQRSLMNLLAKDLLDKAGFYNKSAKLIGYNKGLRINDIRDIYQDFFINICKYADNYD
jgi:hypothetical protein